MKRQSINRLITSRYRGYGKAAFVLLVVYCCLRWQQHTLPRAQTAEQQLHPSCLPQSQPILADYSR